MLWIFVFIYLGRISSSIISGLYGKYVFSFVRNCQTLLHTWLPVLYSHQPRRGVPVALHPCLLLVLLNVLTLAILMSGGFLILLFYSNLHCAGKWYWSVNVHFHSKWYWTTFHVLFQYLFIFHQVSFSSLFAQFNGILCI